MKKSQIAKMPEFFDRYIHLVEDIELIDALEKYDAMEKLIDAETLHRLGDKRYAPGKWTVKDIVQHVTDNERIQSYRALRFARNDKTPLPGYEENLFAGNARAGERSLDDLLEEFRAVRRSGILLFKGFSDEMLNREGTCYNISISVLALGFVLAGHQIHHINIIKERYLPLL